MKHFIQKMSITICVMIFMCTYTAINTHAQILDFENRVDVVLKDGTQVVLFGKAVLGSKDAKSREYYYLPVGLRLAKKPDGTPQFLFMKYTTEEKADAGGVQGGIMHFLMEWGLTQAQEREALALLKKKFSKGSGGSRPAGRLIAKKAKTISSSTGGEPKIMGAVPVTTEGESFKIISATLSDESSAKLITSGKAPTVPGGKAAVAGKLDKYAAQLLAATFEKSRSITDVSIALDFKYKTLAPAVEGYIKVDWSKIHNQGESLEAEYKKWQSGKEVHTKKALGITYYKKTTPLYSKSYEEMRNEYDFLQEKEAIEVQFDQGYGGEASQKIQEVFFQFFLNMTTEKDDTNTLANETEEEAKSQVPNIQYGRGYKYKKSFTKNLNHKKIQELKISARTMIDWDLQLVGNLGTWYDGVRDNPKCVSSINLNDPFFQHRDINFILDLDAEEMFGQEVNYVTINVKKKRSSGNDFQDQITIDRKFLQEKGINAGLTYARGEDRNPDLYEYKTQWSLRGGNLYPENPSWTRGDWEGVTLAPPVKPRQIELEANLDELQEKGITRVTAQVHYMKFGKEHEENIQISPAKGEQLVSKMIFTDKDISGYAYRLIFNHKTEGKLALEWTPKLNDDYIYAVIPEDLNEKESEIFKMAKDAGKNVLKSATEKVLSKFQSILGLNK